MEECEKYETMDISVLKEEVKRMNKHALFEMAWRLNEVLPDEPIDKNVWRGFWTERAAKAGHADAKYRIAHTFYKISSNGAVIEYRQKAYSYFSELSDDFDCGKLDEYDMEFGQLAKIWLGIMFCMGYGWPMRDVKKGIKLIEEAENLTNNLDGFVFAPLEALGSMYCQGYAQPDEEPTRSDLKKGIKYLIASIQPPQIKNLIQEVGQEIGQRLIEDAKEYLAIAEENLATKVDMSPSEKENLILPSNISQAEFTRLRVKERRERLTEFSYKYQQLINAYEERIKRLKERIASKGL